MLETSYVYHFLMGIVHWFSRQFQNSRLISLFLTENPQTLDHAENSIFYRIFYGVLGGLRRIFFALKLDRLFENSIFRQSYFWCLLTAVLAPFLPTTLVLALAAASFGSLLLCLLCEKERKLKYFAINKYIYIYAGIYLFATLASVSRQGSLLGGLLSILFMLFSIVLINSVNTKKQLRLLVFLFVCAGVLVSFYGFYQFLFPSQFSGVWHDVDMFSDIGFRVYSTLGNPNVLGEYLLLIIPLAFAGVIVKKKPLEKLFFLACTGIMMLCLVLTYSRGCYVGIMVAFAVFLVLIDRRFIFLGIVILLLMPFFLPETILNRFLSIGNLEDSSTSYRLYIYLGTLAMLKDYWLSGIGPGTDAFNKVYPSYAYNGISAPHSHNLFLQVLCDTGICGLIVFLGIIYQYFKATCSALTRERSLEGRIHIIAGISSLAGFLVQSLFDYTFYNYRVMLLFWAVLALGMLFTKMADLKGD